MQISRTSPDVGTINTSYDAAGNARYFQDANQAVLGQVYFTIYDSLSRAVASGIAATDFASLDPLGPPQPFETTRTNWLIARRYDAMPPDSTPWNLFPTPPTLLNISARLAGVASKSNGAWQVTYFSYDAEGQIANDLRDHAADVGHLLRSRRRGASDARALRADLLHAEAAVAGGAARLQVLGTHPEQLL